MIVGLLALLILAAYLVALPFAWKAAYGPSQVTVYFDFADWWVGVYVGPNHLYICVIPTLVIRWRRYGRESEPKH